MRREGALEVGPIGAAVGAAAAAASGAGADAGALLGSVGCVGTVCGVAVAVFGVLRMCLGFAVACKLNRDIKFVEILALACLV